MALLDISFLVLIYSTNYYYTVATHGDMVKKIIFAIVFLSVLDSWP